MRRLIRYAERKTAIDARVQKRLTDLHTAVDTFSDLPQITTEDWVKLREQSRRGLRIALRFKNKDYAEFFGQVYRVSVMECIQRFR